MALRAWPPDPSQSPTTVVPVTVPEPNSVAHLSLALGHPNDYDPARAAEDGRNTLGDDIMIHGGATSNGCPASGDEVAEEVYVRLRTELEGFPVTPRRRRRGPPETAARSGATAVTLLRRDGRAATQAVVGCAALLVAACGLPNHHLVHPSARPPEVVTWTAEFQRDGLLVHVEGARPDGAGPFPTVLVHPEGGKTARDMRGVIWDLAGRGYAVLAADYRRWSRGAWRRNVIAWRSPEDARLLLDVTRAYREIDQERIGVLGFSQGGVFSLLIAAHAPDRVRAVVAYYPVTDFPRWLARPPTGPFERLAFGAIRRWFRRESEAVSDADFEVMLRHASAWYVAEDIRAPVLLLHGEHDALAPVEESRRMAERLAAAGRTVELVVPAEGVHLFNFRQRRLAAAAWATTIDWLDRHVRARST